MTPDQCRAARALLRWSQALLGKYGHLSAGSVRHYESGRRPLNGRHIPLMQAAMEAAGIEFIPPQRGKGPGVRFASSRYQDSTDDQVRVLKGKKRAKAKGRK